MKTVQAKARGVELEWFLTKGGKKQAYNQISSSAQKADPNCATNNGNWCVSIETISSDNTT